MVEKNEVRRGYDELADAYAASRSAGGMAKLDQFLDTCGRAARYDPLWVLDAGCGQGTPVLSRLSARSNVVGLDFSREMLSLSATNAPDAALVSGDMTALPFGSDVFDAIVAYWSLIHVPADDHRAVIEEFARVLTPGGRLLVNEGAEAWTGENPDWMDTGVEMQWSIAGAEATREQLRNAGFTIVEQWGAPEMLGEDEDAGDEDESGSENDPWMFFSTRLDG